MLVQINLILHAVLWMFVATALSWLKPGCCKQISLLVDQEIRDMSGARFHHQPSPEPRPL